MKSKYWIEQAMEKSGLRGYELAEKIQMTQGALSNHKNGKRHTLDDEQCILIAEFVGISADKIIADQHAERAESEVVKNYWLKFAGAAASILSVSALLPALSTAPQYILCKIEDLSENDLLAA